MLELLKKQNFVMMIMGEQAYQHIFTPMLLEEWQTHHDKWTKSKNKRLFTRVILTKQGLMVVGNRLQDGQGAGDKKSKIKDPTMCLHPEGSMQMRGAKEAKDYHWICKDCMARWDRQPLSDFPKAYTTEPDHKNLVTFGKLTGVTFQEAYKD